MRDGDKKGVVTVIYLLNSIYNKYKNKKGKLINLWKLFFLFLTDIYLLKASLQLLFPIILIIL